MKLVQLNMWCGKLDKLLEEFFEKEKPDLVCLQEAPSYENGDSYFFTTIEDIQKILGHVNSFLSPTLSMKYMDGKFKYGNAILSRYPFIEQTTTFTNLQLMELTSQSTGSRNIRNFQHVIIDVNGRRVNLLNHHGYHIPNHKDGDSETLRQMKQLANYIKGLAGPVILTGDFNLSPHSESLEQINAILTNLSIKNNLDTTRTKLTHKAEVCDYIFVNDEVDVVSFNASNDVVSDHMALILDFN